MNSICCLISSIMSSYPIFPVYFISILIITKAIYQILFIRSFDSVMATICGFILFNFNVKMSFLLVQFSLLISVNTTYCISIMSCGFIIVSFLIIFKAIAFYFTCLWEQRVFKNTTECMRACVYVCMCQVERHQLLEHFNNLCFCVVKRIT